MIPTPHTTAPRTRSASRALFREAFACFADFSTTLLDAIYTFLVLDLPAWAVQQEEKIATRLFADEAWEKETPMHTPIKKKGPEWLDKFLNEGAEVIRQRPDRDSNVYSEPFEVPRHVHDDPNHWAKDLPWLVPGITLAALVFYLWPVRLLCVIAGVVLVLAVLTLRKG